MIFILIPILLLIAYVIGLIGVRHTQKCGSKIAGLLYGISVMLLSLIMLIPSFEIIEVGEHLPLSYWLWMLFAASPMILSWLIFWNGFRKRGVHNNWIAGGMTTATLVGTVIALYQWPEPIQAIGGAILRLFPSLGYPIV